MKRIFLLSFLLFTFCDVLSQTSNDKIIYLDSLGNYSDETSYDFMWVIKDYYSNQDFYEATEFFKSGKVKTIGIYSDKINALISSFIDNIPLQGMIKEFYESGNKKSITNLTNIESSKKFEWYENGEKKSEREYSLKKEEFSSFNKYGTITKYDNRFLQFWDENGAQKVIQGTGEYEYDDKFQYEKGNYVRGRKEGVWTGKDKKNNFTYSETYIDGKLIKGISLDSKNIEHNYKTISEPPKLKKKENKFLRETSVFNAIHTKQDSIAIYIEKVAILRINISGITTISSIYGFDNESEKNHLIEVLNKYNEYSPSIIRGIPIPNNLTYRFLTNRK